MPHHADEAQLLEGGLYLSLGMHNEAGRRFEALLKDPVPSGVRNVAWFYLAQVWYARGYLDKAGMALARVNGRMSPELEAQKELLLGNVLIHQGKYDEAVKEYEEAGQRGVTPGSFDSLAHRGQTVVEVPFDPHLRPGGVIDVKGEMARATRRTFLRIAASVAGFFASRPDEKPEQP